MLSHRNTGETQITVFGDEAQAQFATGARKFYEEAEMIARFRGHPNIVEVFEFFYENNTAYYVMEYLDGTDLKQRIRRQRLSEGETVFLIGQVCRALETVHAASVLHRDIAPDNIFICNNGDVKLIDFGAARQVVGEATQSLSVILKQDFAPVEQFQKHGEQGPWTDIYALGATAFRAATDANLPDSLSRLSEDTADFSMLSDGLGKVTAKMTAVHLRDRYQNVAAVLDDLQRTGIVPVPIVAPSAQDGPAAARVSPKDEPIAETVPNDPAQETQSGKRTGFLKTRRGKVVLCVLAAAILILAVVIALTPDRHVDPGPDTDTTTRREQTTAVVKTTAPTKAVTTEPAPSALPEAKKYTAFLQNGGWEQILSDYDASQRDIAVEACFVDVNDDGVRELLLRLTDQNSGGVSGHFTISVLLGIRGSDVEIQGAAEYGGGSGGGDFLNIKYDKGSEKHVLILESYSRVGVYASDTEQTVFDTSRTDTPVTVYGLEGENTVIYNSDYILRSTYYSETYYAEQIEQIKGDTTLYKSEDNGITVFRFNGRYISEEQYDQLSSNLVEPTDAAYQLKQVTVNDPIPG